MYLYLGEETVILTGDIVGIFDLENTSTSGATKQYLRSAQRGGRVTAVSSDLPKSFVVCASGGKQRVYLSLISPATLKKRAAFLGNV